VAPQANTNLPNVEDIKRRLGHVLQLVKMKLVKFQLISLENKDDKFQLISLENKDGKISADFFGKGGLFTFVVR
jgi:hypothetical protein